MPLSERLVTYITSKFRLERSDHGTLVNDKVSSVRELFLFLYVSSSSSSVAVPSIQLNKSSSKVGSKWGRHALKKNHCTLSVHTRVSVTFI